MKAIIDLQEQARANIKRALRSGATYTEADSTADPLGRIVVLVIPQGSAFRYVFLTEWSLLPFDGDPNRAEFTDAEAEGWEILATDEPNFAGEEFFTIDPTAVFADFS